MSARTFKAAVAQLLATDAQLQADLTALLGAPVTRVLASNQPWSQIPVDLYPCWVVEQGDGRAASIVNDGTDSLAIGGGRQDFESTLDIALLWSQPDREAAATARSALPAILARLLLRNPQPGVSQAWLQGWQPDQGINHPRHLWTAEILGQYRIRRN